MKEELEHLRGNFERLKEIGELYEELMSRDLRKSRELEEAITRYKALKNQALKLSLNSRKLIKKIESEDIP